ncbi:MAG TPA: hypothetical protein VN665_01695 [Candidatus Paceibacterota bacterium]|nr:hypothetical protein [Candidatus Paceibacterota bacterium]
MNRTLIILLSLVVVLGVAIGITLYVKSSPTPTASTQQGNGTPVSVPNVTTPPPPGDSNSKEAVQAAYEAELAKHPSDNTKLYQTVIEGNYALQVYAGNVLGGEALLKYDQTQDKWILVDGGGGSWSINELVVEGVPRATATALLSDVTQ